MSSRYSGGYSPKSDGKGPGRPPTGRSGKSGLSKSMKEPDYDDLVEENHRLSAKLENIEHEVMARLFEETTSDVEDGQSDIWKFAKEILVMLHNLCEANEITWRLMNKARINSPDDWVRTDARIESLESGVCTLAAEIARIKNILDIWES